MKQFTKEDPVYQIGFRDGYSEGYAKALAECNKIAQRHLEVAEMHLERINNIDKNEVQPCAKE